MRIYHSELFGLLHKLTITEYLECCLNKLSTQSFDSSTGFGISLQDVCITPMVISLLVQILNHPLPRAHTKNGIDSKWDRVELHDCYFKLQNPISTDQRYCTDEDIRSLFSTLSTRTQKLVLFNGSFRPQAFAFLTRFLQQDQLEVNCLDIFEAESPPPFQYARLGDAIQRSTHLTKLVLHLRFAEVPHEMFESLSNAINIQKLCLRQFHETSDDDHDQVLRHLVGDEHGTGVVGRLLQNPQSRLQHLKLRCMRLEVRHCSVIARLLPTSRLKVLDVSHNQIQSRGIMEFAQQLPRIQSLKTIILAPNPWLPKNGRSSIEVKECGVALVQGMKDNFSVEDLGDFTRLVGKLMVAYPQSHLLMYFTDLNRAGRRILGSRTSIPLGLWPHILERAGTTISYLSSAIIWNGGKVARTNAVFFLLQNCPIFCHKPVNASEENTTSEPLIQPITGL